MLNGKQIHFIGIGGIGMSGLASICRERGFAINGCDVKAGRMQQLLQQRGIPVALGHHPSHLTSEVGLAVYSSAISSQEAELREARTRGIQTVSRGELLAELASSAQLVAVAGAHGKTTTSGMAAQLLVQAGWDPTAVVGGTVLSLGSNARNGSGRYLVAETDESDGSFLLLQPAIAIVTNIDREHLNYYRTFENLVAAFRQFVRRLGPSGILIRCEDDPIARETLSHASQLTYGLKAQADVSATAIKPCPFDFAQGNGERVKRVEPCGLGSEFTATYQGQRLGTFRLQVPGRHNVLNALAIVCLGLVLDIPMVVVREALWVFRGTSRRFQLLTLPHDIWFIDDYAHHPAEIRATLAASAVGGASDPFLGRRRVVVFQPHRFTRTKLLEQEFMSCFEQADGLIITDIYSAHEPPIPQVSGERLAGLIRAQGTSRCVRYVPRSELLGFLSHFVQPEDCVFFLGAGDIGDLCHELARQLRAIQRAAG
jgi:UDP-N-acetylmuramate--alanine ligase